jgi:hypothetical protein
MPFHTISSISQSDSSSNSKAFLILLAFLKLIEKAKRIVRRQKAKLRFQQKLSNEHILIQDLKIEESHENDKSTYF